MIAGLPLRLALKQHGVETGNCFFCTIQVEDNTHRFIQCSIACQIWSYNSQIWQVLHDVLLRQDRGCFLQFTMVDLFLRYWGLCYNWDMHNAFAF